MCWRKLITSEPPSLLATLLPQGDSICSLSLCLYSLDSSCPAFPSSFSYLSLKPLSLKPHSFLSSTSSLSFLILHFVFLHNTIASMLPYIYTYILTYTHIYFLTYFPSLLCLTPTPILCRPLLHILFHTFKTFMVFYFISFHFNIIKSLGSPSTWSSPPYQPHPPQDVQGDHIPNQVPCWAGESQVGLRPGHDRVSSQGLKWMIMIIILEL